MEIKNNTRIAPPVSKPKHSNPTTGKSDEVIYTKKDIIIKSDESFDQTNSNQPIVYSKTASLDDIRLMEERRMNAFQEMLSRMLSKQGEAFQLTLFGNQYNVSAEESKEAAISIADGGEYSVDAVATRIMDMAIALADGDKSKADTLRAAVEQGFSAASKTFGGQMPSITNQTHKEVMKRFDEWMKEE